MKSHPEPHSMVQPQKLELTVTVAQPTHVTTRDAELRALVGHG